MSDDSDFRTSEQLNELSTALAAAQAEFPVIAKTKQGKVKGRSKASGREYEYSYAYADIADVLHGILPVLAKHKLSVIQPTFLRNGAIYIRTRLLHASGQWIESVYPVSGVTGDHQAMGGALTYARRYALTALLGVASDEDTDRGETAAAGSTKAIEEDPTNQLAADLVDGLNGAGTLRHLERTINNPRYQEDFKRLSAENQTWVKTREESRRAEIEAEQKEEPQTNGAPAGGVLDRSPHRPIERQPQPRQPALDDDIPF